MWVLENVNHYKIAKLFNKKALSSKGLSIRDERRKHVDFRLLTACTVIGSSHLCNADSLVSLAYTMAFDEKDARRLWHAEPEIKCQYPG